MEKTSLLYGLACVSAYSKPIVKEYKIFLTVYFSSAVNRVCFMIKWYEVGNYGYKWFKMDQ